MANQYSRGKPLTESEKEEDSILLLQREVAELTRQLGYAVNVMAHVYKQYQDPYLARCLLVMGAPVHAIDEELDRKTVYATPRNTTMFHDHPELRGL